MKSHKCFEPVIRKSLWQDVPESDWANWIWQQKRRIKAPKDLNGIIELTDSELIGCENENFRMGITPYYASLMDPTDQDCPIRKQCIPHEDEGIRREGELEDPLAEESYMPVPGITHRYPDRVLFYTTHHCPVYCRHCTRKRKVSDPQSLATKDQWLQGIEYIRQHPEVRDVLLSGGDPLSNTDDRLEFLLRELSQIESVEVIRIGTRNPVTLPQRITADLCKVLSRYPPLYVHTHFNHPRECTLEAFEACAKLAEAGCVLGNQMVLMKGINDDPETVFQLNRRLLMMRVRPYYIIQCDLAYGVSHFRTPIQTGVNIINRIRGWSSGMAVPHFVVDLPGGGGKISLDPEYVVERNDKNWVFRNYQGKLFEYTDV